MLPRSLLQQRLLFRSSSFHPPLSRNLSFARTQRLACAVEPAAFPSLPCRHFSISWRRRNAVIEATASSATSAPAPAATSAPKDSENEANNDDEIYNKVYLGPLESTFRRLKVFSLASLSLSTTLAPFIFVIESNLPMNARLALASIAITTSATSTGMVAWCGKPYVTQLRYIRPEENGGAEGMEMTTMSLWMKPMITRVYDPSFLVETRRAFAKWELAQKVVLPKEPGCERQVVPGQEETIAETRDKDGNPLGRWVVTWGENGEGTCRELGHVIRYFNVHEELLP
ncbi:hypothetical protein P691DRAFT_733088 [Macrolepiota fuliginosa MF-IS2]|uniref:Uncharacterized protein n=1 Tax=Macrolepiota fuliginosa MF-IS2 TaxID=1400762 RepID=A0A9P6C2B4_9AGAR|nr:hypothetical protein P691DRAFT_733088 [Macrolepiota fuliginosa MF-IS2]